MIAKKTARKPARKFQPRNVMLSAVAVEYVEKYRDLLQSWFNQRLPGAAKGFEINDSDVIESVLSSAWAASVRFGSVAKLAHSKLPKTAKK